jgi:hypothetical protein
MFTRHNVVVVLVLLGLANCIRADQIESSSDGTCAIGLALEATRVPSCLLQRQVIDAALSSRAESVLLAATNLRDSLRTYVDTATFRKAADMTRALTHVVEFYTRGLLDDSSRFNRIIDHVTVSQQFVSGRLTQNPTYTLRWSSPRTPGLVWVYYPNNGLFFMPVSTYQSRFMIFPAASTQTDSLAVTAAGMERYLMHRTFNGTTFGVWEYDFYWQTAGIFLALPWVSAMAQGGGMVLFSEMYRRTGDMKWRQDAYEVFNSYKVHWENGGVWLSDTVHGYWWDEYDPVDRVWNGSVLALIDLGFFANVMGDTVAQSMYQRGIDAVKYWTRFYDTGSWTLYSLNQGLNSRFYHQWQITLLDTLYQQTQDPWFSTLATKWRSYTPPPGVP